MSDPIAVPHLELLVKGQSHPALFRDLVSVTVKEALGMVSEFTVNLRGWDMDALELAWVDSTALVLGTRVEIRMGYVNAVTSLISGEILSHSLSYEADSLFSLTITGQDRRHRLGRGEKRRVFKDKSDVDIAKEIAMSNGLQLEGEPTTPVHKYVIQRNITDLAFLNQRAHRCGRELMVSGTKLLFKALNLKGLPDLTLSPANGLLSFSASVSSSGRVGKVVVQTSDPGKKGGLTGQVSIPANLPGILTGDQVYPDITKTIIRPSLETQEEVDEEAALEAARLAENYLTASASCFGNPKVRAGSVIKLEGLGYRFSQKYLVTSATHSYSVSGGYSTSFELQGNV